MRCEKCFVPVSRHYADAANSWQMG